MKQFETVCGTSMGRAGNVVRNPSVSQVDILTLQRPAARADVLEAQTTELK